MENKPPSEPPWRPDCLPDIHKPDGERPRHDDWPWPLSLIPRGWSSFCLDRPPKLLFGTQRSWNNVYDTTKTTLNSDWPGYGYGPKPVPEKGTWQFSLVPLLFKGFRFWLPYFALTTKNLWHFRIGNRWSDGDEENYATFPSIALRKLK